MRKFKFMSKAVVGMMAVAMTMGSLSGVAFRQPTAVYAAASEITLTNGETAVTGDLTIKQGESLTLTATAMDGETDETVECVIAKSDETAQEGLSVTEATSADSKDIVITVAETVPVGAYKLTITAKTTTSLKKEVTINVTAKTPVTPPEEDDDELHTDVGIDLDKMVLYVYSNEPYFTVDILKTASDTEKPSKSYVYANTPSTWVEDDEECVQIDLAFLKVKKANYINVYGASVTDKTKGKIITIEAQPTKEKFTVDATKDSLAGAIGKTTAADAAKYEMRSSFGSNWTALDEFDFNAAKIAGTTVVVRKASETSGTGTSVKYTPAGPEIKVKIPAAPKAPKVTVDYAKGTVKVTDKMQIAQLKEDNKPISETAKPEEGGWRTAKKGMSRKELAKELLGDENSTAEFTMVVRTAASGKKSASMPVIVTIKGQPVLDYEEGKKDSVKVTVGTTTSTLKATRDKDGGLTFTANGNFEYEDGGKWKKITSGKLIKNFSSDKVNVRLAGVKADKSPNSGSFESTQKELEVPKPVEKDETEATFDKITVTAVANSDDYTAPTAAELVASDTPITDPLVFKYTAKATKGESSEAVSGVTVTWKVTAPTDSTADMTKWTWDQASGTLTIGSGATLVAGTYKVTATSGSVTSTPAIDIVIAPATSSEP